MRLHLLPALCAAFFAFSAMGETFVPSGGGSSSGTVAQGAPGSSAWLVVDATLAASVGIISGSSNPTSGQQIGLWTGGEYVAWQGAGDGSATVNIDTVLGGGTSGTPLYVTSPAGAVAISANQVLPYTTTANGAATATKAVLVGCEYLSSAETWTNGQQGAALCDSTGKQYVNVATISASSMPLPTGAATSYAQASTTTGQTGPLIQAEALGATNANYTVGQTDPLTQTTGGILRTILSSATGINNAVQNNTVTTAGGADVTIDGIYEPLSGITALTAGQQEPALTDTTGAFVVDAEVQKATYRASSTIAVAATAPGDVWQMCGVASKEVRLRQIKLQGFSTSAEGEQISIAKRSTADSGGTSTAATSVSVDSGNAASAATISAYTANPTPGTSLGVLDAEMLAFPTAAAAVAPTILVMGAPNGDQSWTLRSSTDCFAINFGSVTPATAATLIVNVEYTVN